MLTFKTAGEKLGNRDRKKLENNTYLVRVDDKTFGVKLHNTIVVYIHQNGRFTLDTGGWRTNTTKDRINRYGPASVHQNNNIWYIGQGIFEDGVIVNGDGKPVTKLREPGKVQRVKRKLDKLVLSYIRGFADHVKFNGLFTGEDTAQEPAEWDVVKLGPRPEPIKPGPGDCLICQLESNNDKKSLGVDHLLSHMTDEDGPYYVPALLFNALKENSGNVGVVWHMIAHYAKRGDTRLLERYLTQYFRKRKPALLELMQD